MRLLPNKKEKENASDDFAVFPWGQSTGGLLLRLPADHALRTPPEDQAWFRNFLRDVSAALEIADPVIITANDAELGSLRELRAVASRFVFAQARAERSPAKAIPGPEPHAVVGNVMMFLDNPHKTYMELPDKYGPVCEVHFFNFRFVVVSDPELMALFLNESPFFTKRVTDTAFEEVKEIGGTGLFTTDTTDRSWIKAHKLLLPSFSAKALQRYVPAIVRCCQQCIDVWHQIGYRRPILIKEWTTRVAFQAIGLCGFNFDFKMMEAPDSPLHPFIVAMSECLFEAQKRAFRTKFWKKLPIEANRVFQNNMDLMSEIVDEVIRERLAERELKERSGSSRAAAPGDDEFQDVLQFMVDNYSEDVDKGFSQQEIRDQIITFLIAGNETTSNLLAWTLWLLTQHPEVERKLVAEIRAAMPEGGAPTIAELNKMPYLMQVIKESLRLYPTFPRVQKMCIHPCRLGPYQIHQGDTVEANFLPLHRNSPTWGDSPSTFNPDRFSPDKQQAQHPYAWLPFSAGARSCIGSQFALLEARIFLAMVLPVFRFAPTQHCNAEIDPKAPSLQPLHLEMVLLPRDGSDAGADAGGDSTGGAARVEPKLASSASSAALLSRPVALPNLPAINIVYGSTDGRCEQLALALARTAHRINMPCTTTSMDAAPFVLADAKPDGTPRLVIVVTGSLYGQAPQNARRFLAWLRDQQQASVGKEAGDKALAPWYFATFSSGDSRWSFLHSFGRKVDAMLASAGATRLLVRGEEDLLNDSDSKFEHWTGGLWAVLLDSFATNANMADLGSGTVLDSGPSFRVKKGGTAAPAKGVLALKVEAPAGAKRHPALVHEIKLAVSSGADATEAGQLLRVVAPNAREDVDKVGKILGWNLDETVEIVYPDHAKPSMEGVRALPAAATVRELLTEHVDLHKPLSHQVVPGRATLALVDLTSKVLPKVHTVEALLPLLPLSAPVYVPLSSRSGAASAITVVADGQSQLSRALCGGISEMHGELVRRDPRLDAIIARTDAGTPFVFVSEARRIGLCLALLRELAGRADNKGLSAPGTLVVIHDSTSRKDFPFTTELEALVGKGVLEHVFWGVDGKKLGRVFQNHGEELWAPIEFENASIMVTGTPRLNKAILEQLQLLGHTVGHHTEQTARDALAAKREMGNLFVGCL